MIKFDKILGCLREKDNFDGTLVLKGAWNANTNTPTLTSGVGTSGDYYVVTVAGNTNLDGISNWVAGDELFFDGSIWNKVGSTELWYNNSGTLTPITPTLKLLINNDITSTQQLISTVVTGTAPIMVCSTTKVINLNSDQLDGYHYNNLPYLTIENDTLQSVMDRDNITDKQIISTVTTGTPPMLVCSTTVITNFNSDMLDGYHYDNLPYLTVESDTLQSVMNRGATTNTQFISTLSIGVSPFDVTSTTLNTNLNADLWDGYQFSDYLNQAVRTSDTPTFASLKITEGGTLKPIVDSFDYVGAKVAIVSNRTTEAKTTRGTAFRVATRLVAGEYLWMMKSTTFSSIYFDINTANVGSNFVWEYSKGGDVWGSLSITDGTNGFTTDGNVTFTPPVDWATDTVNSQTGYFIRVQPDATPSTPATAYLVVPENRTTDLFSFLANVGDTLGWVVDKNGMTTFSNVLSMTADNLTDSAIGATQVLFGGTAGLLTGSVNFTYNTTNNFLYVNGIMEAYNGFVAGTAGAIVAYNTYFYSGWKNVNSADSGVFFRADGSSMDLYQATSGAVPSVSRKGGYTGALTRYDFAGATCLGGVTADVNDSYKLKIIGNQLFATTGTLYFRDTGISISSDNDGYLDIKADVGVRVNNFVRHTSANYRRYYHLPISAFDPGLSGATWTNPSANTIGGYRLNASTETLNFDSDVHGDWDGVSDLNVELYFAVNIDNTAGGVGDTVDLRLQCFYNTVGETTTKTQTVEVATVVGQSAQYKVFKADFVINYDETSNVVEAGDLFGFILNLETDTSEVDDIILLHGTINYNTTHLGIENGDT